MKKAAVFLMILLLLTMISACSQITPTTIPKSGSVTPEVEPYSSSESRTEETVVVNSSDTTSSSETESTALYTSEPPDEQSPDSTTSQAASILHSPAESEAPINTTAPTNEPTAPTHSTDESKQAETTPPSQTEQPPQESAPPAEQPKPEVPPEPPIQETDPQPEPPTTEEPTSPPVEEPAFDISYWVQYARSYAVSVGLQLHEEAIYCWDTPISANAKCLYLERDIQSRLNRYAGDEEITLVWIWTVELSEGNYEIYIGYA